MAIRGTAIAGAIFFPATRPGGCAEPAQTTNGFFKCQIVDNTSGTGGKGPIIWAVADDLAGSALLTDGHSRNVICWKISNLPLSHLPTPDRQFLQVAQINCVHG